MFALFVGSSVTFAQDDARFKIGSNDVFKGPVGLQLYSLRDTFAQDVEKGFDVAEELGFGYVELAGKYGLSNEDMVAKLKERHLTPIAGHWDYNLFKNDPEAVAKEAKALGLKYAGVAWIPHDGDFDEQDVEDAAKTFNRAGKVLWYFCSAGGRPGRSESDCIRRKSLGIKRYEGRKNSDK